MNTGYIPVPSYWPRKGDPLAHYTRRILVQCADETWGSDHLVPLEFLFLNDMPTQAWALCLGNKNEL